MEGGKEGGQTERTEKKRLWIGEIRKEKCLFETL